MATRDLAPPAMLQILALILALAPETSVLSPEAAEHNRKAMVFYDAGQLAPAVDEFFAAYQSMPDPRRDQPGRRHLIGSMSMTLRQLHEITHEAAPLCRLHTLLKIHIDGLMLAFPDQPDSAELTNVRWHYKDVTRLLAAYGPEACESPRPPQSPATTESPPPPPQSPATAESPPPPPQSPGSPPKPSDTDEIPPHHLRIAGGVTLGLGVALLGGVVFGVVTQHQQRASAREFDADQPDHFLTRAESDQLQEHLARARLGHRLAIGTGLAAGVMTAMGTTFLVLARRSARARRWSAAPWWSTAGAGLTVQIQLGSSHF